MRVALITPCTSAVSAATSSDTHFFVYELARHLQRRHHDVTLFATGDSTNAGHLRAHYAHAVTNPHGELRHASFAFEEIATSSDDPFDVIHSFAPPLLAFSTLTTTPVVHTIDHGRDDALVDFYREFGSVTFTAPSRHHAELYADVGIESVVLPGISADEIPFGTGKGGYAVYASEISPANGTHIAVDAARIAGAPLVMVAEANAQNHAYFEIEVRPRYEDAQIDITKLGTTSRAHRQRVLRDASVLVVATQTEGAIDLAVIEAMIAGTPVVALDRSAAAEMIDEAVTGYIVHSRSEMATRIHRILQGGFDRRRCRARALEQWSCARAAEDYERVYESLVLSKHVDRPYSDVVPRSEAVFDAVEPGMVYNPLFTRSAS